MEVAVAAVSHSRRSFAWQPSSAIPFRSGKDPPPNGGQGAVLGIVAPCMTVGAHISVVLVSKCWVECGWPRLAHGTLSDTL